MNWEGFGKILQLAGAALGIPAAVAGTYSVYRTYFSTDVACQNLKATIIAAVEKKVSPETRRALLKKDMADFAKTCAHDPDAHDFLEAVNANLEPPAAPPARQAAAAPVVAAAGPVALPPGRPDIVEGSGAPAMQTAAVEPAPLRGPLAGRPYSSLPPLGFAKRDDGERKGWVSLAVRGSGRRDDINFDGFAVADRELPPTGTALIARWPLPIWREPQGPPPNDLREAQGRLRLRDCVRVISTQATADRLWAEVAPCQ